MRRALLSLLALTFLGTFMGCRCVGGSCDCYGYCCYPPCYGPCGTGNCGNFANGSGGCSSCGGGCGGCGSHSAAPAPSPAPTTMPYVSNPTPVNAEPPATTTGDSGSKTSKTLPNPKY